MNSQTNTFRINLLCWALFLYFNCLLFEVEAEPRDPQISDSALFLDVVWADVIAISVEDYKTKMNEVISLNNREDWRDSLLNMDNYMVVISRIDEVLIAVTIYHKPKKDKSESLGSVAWYKVNYKTLEIIEKDYPM